MAPFREALETLVQLARAQHRQHHELLEFGDVARNSDLLADHRAGPVAADDVVRLQHVPLTATLLGNGDADALAVLLDSLAHPTEAGFHARQRGRAIPQHRLGLILRQPLVGLEIVVAHHVAPLLHVPEFVHQVVVGGDLADRIAPRHHPGRPQLIDDAPEIEMLGRTVGQVLALGDSVRAGTGLHQHA